MRKYFVFLAVFFLFTFISASSVEDEIQRITHYAEEYETGNIDYVQLQLYLSSVRQNLNGLLGITDKDEGGLLNDVQIEAVLGEPTEETGWAWVEGQDREKRLEESVPAWNKIIFDGKKIQIRIEAWPSLFSKRLSELERKIRELEEREASLEEIEELKEKFKEESSSEGTLVYRLHFNVEFKRPQEQLDIQSKISGIQQLAQEFSSNPSSENAENLAKESVNAERAFESYIKQNQDQCIDLMKSVFGSENQRSDEKLIVKEVIFYQGENFDAIARLEMCDDCEWNWIGLNFWIESRGFNMQEDQGGFDSSPDEYRNLEFSDFEEKIRDSIEEYKNALESKDWKGASKINQKIWALSDAWNQKSNDVWQEIEPIFEAKRQAMNQEQQNEYYSNYGWIKDEQEKRKMVRELSKQNYEKRKIFYENLFSYYDLRKESYFEQISFEKRLIEEFKEFGEEICNNNIDDNKNEQIDCSESQCGGKICGKETIEITEGNETGLKTVDLYCIAGACQRKEEIVETNQSVCGNNICEEGEASNTLQNGTCSQDCANCQEYPALECVGRVIFSGKDANGCALEPICLNETESCTTDQDCSPSLCGIASCIENRCQVSTLTECRESECIDGQERAGHCNSGEDIIIEVCVDGLWSGTNILCESGEETNETEEVAEEEIVGVECIVRTDCGGEDDVCSNGRCVTIPQTTEIEEEFEEIGQETGFSQTEEIQENEQEENSQGEETSEESQAEQPQEEQNIEPEEGITGGVIFNFFRSLAGKISRTSTGLSVEESPLDTSTSESNSDNSGSDGSPNSGSGEGAAQTGESASSDGSEGIDQGIQQEGQPPNEQGIDNREERQRQDDEEREQEDGQRREDEREMRENECGKRCERECYDIEIRPCAEECIFKECGQNFDCDTDEVKNSCENSCKEGKDIGVCKEECNDKCIKGEETWKEPERKENKEEKGVFTIGGNCRTAKGKTEGFIWFGGWGDPFQKIQPLKTRYYSGGGDWCKWDLENLVKQRKEFEQGFNQEFVEWFFNSYLANSAEDWESHISGIFELYWRDVDLSREMANRMKCLNKNELPEHTLIGPLIYESDFGSIEFWEEVTMGKIDREGNPVPLITPYMKIWILPSKEVIKFEMKKAMKEHRFPGPQDEENSQNGPSEEEKEFIRQDNDFMNKIKKLSEKYGGSFDGSIQIMDSESEVVIFNIYVEINEEDIIKITPMLPEETPERDATMKIDFEKIYDIIDIEEKEMQSTRVESPPWAPKKIKPTQKVKEVVSGVKMYFKVRSMVSSAEVEPSSAKDDVKSIFGDVMKMMMGEPDGEPEREEEPSEEEITSWESKESLTGNVIG